MCALPREEWQDCVGDCRDRLGYDCPWCEWQGWRSALASDFDPDATWEPPGRRIETIDPSPYL